MSCQNIGHVLYYLHPEQKRKHHKHCQMVAAFLGFSPRICTKAARSARTEHLSKAPPERAAFKLLQSPAFLSRQKVSHIFM